MAKGPKLRTIRSKLRQMPPRPPQPGEHIRPDIPNDILLLIGRIVTNWSKLEGTIEHLIWKFLCISEMDGRRITSRLSTSTKIETLSSLVAANLKEPNFTEEWDIYMQHLNMYKEERNFIVHGQWNTLMPDNVPICASLRETSPIGDYTAETFPQERLQIINDGIIECHKSLFRLLDPPDDRPIDS